MRTPRSRLAAIAAAATLLATVASTVSAAPVERTRSTIQCAAASVTLVMHPGWAASVLWDISTEDVPNAPSYIMKKIEGSVYVDGVLTSTFSTSIGKMTGFGEPLLCAWEVHEPGRDIYGTSELVHL